MINIRPISYTDEAYTLFVARYGGVFNQPEWLKLYGENICPTGIYNLNNELIGVFNLYKATKFSFTFYIVPPYSPSNAFVLLNPAESYANRATFEKTVHTHMADYFSSLSKMMFLTAFPTTVTDTQPYYWSNYKVVPNYTYLIDLQRTPEELLSGLTAEKRKSLRKAEKDGIVVEPCQDYNLVMELVLKTFRRKEKKLNGQLVKKILFEFAGPANSFAFVAYSAGKPLACTFCVHDGNRAYYLFGGYDDALKHHGAGPSCMWQAINHARHLGLKIFDFEGSMLPEVERYFREFGGVLTPYYTVQKAWLPFEILLKFKMRSRF